mmetsp:Transcript_27380/g.37736  ORF Transcript_27380/g.37736 Transcript_27380/m.37736 type:complete len:204 (+) Transcript_27380:99-710(+)
MFKPAFLALLALFSVSAFNAPVSRQARSTTTMMAEKSKSLPFLPQPPNTVGLAGDVGFDPLGFSNWIDVRWLREAELKHGRISMLAVLGFVATSFVQLPGEVHQVSVVAAHDAAVKSGAMSQILLWTSLFELVSFKAVSEMLEGSGRAPGDFGFDPLKFSAGKSDKVKEEFAVKELKNGRLAMLAFSGLVTQAVLTGKDFPYF